MYGTNKKIPDICNLELFNIAEDFNLAQLKKKI